MLKTYDIDDITPGSIWIDYTYSYHSSDRYRHIIDSASERALYGDDHFPDNTIRVYFNQENDPGEDGRVCYSSDQFFNYFVKLPESNAIKIKQFLCIMHQLKLAPDVSEIIYKMLVDLEI